MKSLKPQKNYLPKLLTKNTYQNLLSKFQFFDLHKI